MDDDLERLVRARARQACEYCRLPQTTYRFRFPIDHIIAQQHGGKDTAGNLCLACPRCNSHKGPNLTSIDPVTRKLVRLFNPRRHKWAANFKWDGPILKGKTAIGRATVTLLSINAPSSVEVRHALIEEGIFPPKFR